MGSDGESLSEGEWEAMEGLGLTDGDSDGEGRELPIGEPVSSNGGVEGGEGGAGSVMSSGGRRASL